MATETPSKLKSLLLVAGVTLGAGLMITGAWEVSHTRILENERVRLMANLSSVIDAPGGAELSATPLTATQLSVSEYVEQIFAMREDSQLIAWVYSAVAPGGYNAPIDFLLGITPDGDIVRIRVMQHRETPGLGDAIESGKSDWLTQFEGRNLRNTPRWALKADDGEFDALTGATITPRAMVTAIGALVQYHSANAAEIRTALEETLLESEVAVE